jgi:6-phosphofructokinase 1
MHELRALAGSREQIVVVETFAAKSGYSTLLMGFLGGADRVIIPEVPYDPEELASLIMHDKLQTPANYAILLVCDGSRVVADKTDKYTHLFPSGNGNGLLAGSSKERSSAEGNLVGSGMVAARLLENIVGEDVFLQPLTYLLRTGSPDGQDLLGAANFALTAARLLKEEKYGRMAAFVQNEMWTDIDLKLAAEGVKTVDVGVWYDKDNYKPQLSLIWSV